MNLQLEIAQNPVMAVPEPKVRSRRPGASGTGSAAADASRLLRRLDWRFLLPDSHLRRVIHVGPRISTLGQALETFSDSVAFAEDEPEPKGPAELVVAHEASHSEVEAVLPRLLPGGWLYWELQSGQTLQQADLDWLGRCGISNVQSFWQTDGFENHRWIIPLDDPCGLAMLLRRRFPNVAPKVLIKLAGQLMRSRTLRRKVPVCVIGCRGPAGGRKSFAERFIDAHGVDVGTASPDSSRAYVIATPTFPSSRSVVFLMRPDQACEPTLVAKIARAEGDGDPLAKEAANLRAVKLAGVDVEAPRLIAHGVFERRAILVETALPGPLMQPRQVRRRPEPCIEAGVRWVEQFHRATRLPSCQLPGRMMLLVKSQLKRLESIVAHEPGAPQLLLRVRRETGRLESLCVPLVFEHGDLSSPNLLMLGSKRIGVLDWELGDPRGLPAVDLFFFLAFIAFARARATTPEQCVAAFREAFFGPNAWTHPHIARYAAAVDVPRTALAPLFLLCWSRYLASLPTRMAWAVGRDLTREELAGVRGDRYWHLWKYAAEHIDDIQF